MTLRFLPETPAALAASLTACGYHAGPPPWLPADLLLADVECAAEIICPACGQAGGTLLAFHLLRPRRYMGFAVCGCGAWQEV
jgi:hypothetical protein